LRRIAVRVQAQEAESARARLLEIVPQGFEEVVGDGWVELAAYADADLEAAVQVHFAVVSSEPVGEGWDERWRSFHRPVSVAGLWIGPPWETPPRSEPAVVVDPGRAFGTGAHATTRACIELLARIERGSLLDAGCGSGVVSVAAARLGFSPITAIDADPVAVEVARETARRNGVDIAVRAGDVLADALEVTDAVVANVDLGVVEALLAQVEVGTFLSSGYLACDHPRAPGWTHAERLELDGWAADVFSRSAG
jgi:ribosomal protein L11 methyltransferase